MYIRGRWSSSLLYILSSGYNVLVIICMLCTGGRRGRQLDSRAFLRERAGTYEWSDRLVAIMVG